MSEPKSEEPKPEDRRYSAIHDVQERIQKYFPTPEDAEGEKAKENKEFDAKDVGEGLRQRWVKLCEQLQLPFRVTVLHCEDPEYVIVLSDYTLIEGVSTEVEEGKHRLEYAEIRRKAIKQNTYCWVATNQGGGEATLTEIYQDKFFSRVDSRLEIAGRKKRKMFIVPICWVVGSDGQFERAEDKIRSSIQRRWPSGADIAQVHDILDATLAEDVLQLNELLIQENSKHVKGDKLRGKIDQARNKAIVSQTGQDLKMSGNILNVGMSTRFVNFISNKAFQMVGFITIIYLILSFVLNIIAMTSGAPMPWGFPDLTGNTASTVDPNLPDPLTGGEG